MKRNRFLKTLGGTGLILASSPLLSFNTFQENDPQLDPELVATFVGAGHGNFELIQELLPQYPTLLNAAHDWKYGDFETALGAASHVGNKEIAQYLVDAGAQTNIFTAAVFGNMEIVQAMLMAFPASLYAKGPHGFTLLHHAVKGGNEVLIAYLEELGATEMKVPLY